MSKSNLAVKEVISDIVGEEAILQEPTPNNVRPIKKEKTKTSKKILYRMVKRIIDIIGSLIGIIFLIPATIIIYFARKILKEDQGPLFYEQLRYGKNGKIFRLYKYRSMCIGADEKLKEYLASNEEARKEFKKTHKLQNDPRITKTGKFLRKTSLDEWPQFINVLLGEMSLIGPRPYLPREKKDMGQYYNSIIKCKPGVTGMWQANGRSDVEFNYRCKLDDYYYHNWSIWLDFTIIYKTIKGVVYGKGSL